MIESRTAPDAVKEIDRVLLIDSDNVAARVLRVDANRAAGNSEESIEHFKLARDEAMSGRAPTALNERIREFSRTYPHVHLVDFETTLDRIGAKAGLGCNYFGTQDWCDQFHPNPRTQELIARDVIERLIETRRAHALQK